MALKTYAGKSLNFKYDNSEQWTGEYWIDGSKIYTKTFSVPNFSKSTISVSTGITNVKEVISFSGAFIRSGYTKYYSLDNTYMGEYSFSTTNGVFAIETNNQYVTFAGKVTIRYTCTNR